jgi:hypothetical protein
MPRKKQIIKVKKTQKQKQKVNVVVNVNSNNKKKNVISRQPKMTPQSSVPQVIHIQAPTPQFVTNEAPRHVANSPYMQSMQQAPYRTNIIPEYPPMAAPLQYNGERFSIHSTPQTPIPQKRPSTRTRGGGLFEEAFLKLTSLSNDSEPDPLKEELKVPSQLTSPLTPLIPKPPLTNRNDFDILSNVKKQHAKASDKGKKALEDVFGLEETEAPRNKRAFDMAIKRFGNRQSQLAREGKLVGSQSV